MRSIAHNLIVAALVVAGVLAGPVAGQTLTRYEKITRQLTSLERKGMEGVAALTGNSLERIDDATDPNRLRRQVREILAGGSLVIGAREVLDEQGRGHIHRYIQRRVEQIRQAGGTVTELSSLRGTTGVPVEVDRLAHDDPGPKTTLSVGDESWNLTPLWPNGAMPSVTPAGGLRGPLVYVEAGNWEEIKGLELDGAIALMDFRGGRNWNRLFSLGCKAVIVIEDDFVSRENAAGLACNTPVPFPRYFVDRNTGQAIIQRATHREYATADEWELIEKDEVGVVRGGNHYENRSWLSPFYLLPPTEPVTYTVKEDDLLGRIAQDYGVSPSALAERNDLESGQVLEPEAELAIPGTVNTYTVQEEDLLKRLAANYDLDVEDIVEANPDLLPARLEAGMDLTIPNLTDTMVFLVPIDSVNITPEVPDYGIEDPNRAVDHVHGAKVAANVALALNTMENLATAPTAVRRRKALFAFLDGENNGGLSSRTFAEYMLQHRGEWSSRLKGDQDPAMRIKRYQEAAEWMDAYEQKQLPDGTGQWMVNKWLRTRADNVRVWLAENRVERKRESNDLSDRISNRRGELSEARIEALRRKRQRALDRMAYWEGKLDALVAVREKTLNDRGKSWTERARSFLQSLPRTSAEEEGAEIPMNFESVRQRLEAELSEEKARQEIVEHNLAFMERFSQSVYGERGDRTLLSWFLDLSDGTPEARFTGGWNNAFWSPQGVGVGGGKAEDLASRYRKIVAYASVQADWQEHQWAFLSDDDKLDHSIRTMEDTAPPYPTKLWTVGEVTPIIIGTNNDRMDTLDTPHDNIAHTNFENLSVQFRAMLTCFRVGLERALDAQPPTTTGLNAPKIGRLVGNAVQYNVRSGINAEDPVPGAWVYYPALKNQEQVAGENTLFRRGMRGGILRVAPLNGSYILPADEIKKGSLKYYAFCYRLDRETGLFEKVMDEGEIGTQKQKHDFELLDGQDKEKKFTLTDCYPLVFFPGPDPKDYTELGNAKAGQYIEVIDAWRNGTPQHYGFDNPNQAYLEAGVTANMVYMDPDRGGDQRSYVRIAVRKNVTFKLLLVGKVTDEYPKGMGYPVGPARDPNGRLDRNLALPLTPLKAAGDMLSLAQRRRDVYRKYGIEDRAVNEAVARAGEKYQQAKEAYAAKNYQAGNGRSRESWGILINAYEKILKLGREAVFSVVILMALLLPASWFGEKLVIGSKQIVSKLIGAVVIFALGTTFLNFFHPAFKISVSPFIVVIAFTMILMSMIVLTIMYQRFEVLVRRARIAGGEVESEEISLTSSLATALSLGVSNLKKRPARTALTVFTVTVLTFSIVTFVSVKGRDSVYMRGVEMDTRGPLGEGSVEPIPPKYEGVLFRKGYWLQLNDSFTSAIYSEFGHLFEMSTRGWYLEVEGGNNAAREGVNQETLRHADNKYIVAGVMTFMPNESEFSRLDEAVTGDWFRPADPESGVEGDRYTIILPDKAAEVLGISAGDLMDGQGNVLPRDELPTVDLMNIRWKVVGILDTAKADRMRDIHGRSLAMVDYLRSAFSSNAGETTLATEPDSYYMPWEELVIVPHMAAEDVKAKPRSVAMKFTPGTDVERFRKDVAMRINRGMFIRHDGEMALMTTEKSSDVGGLAKIVVPVILCILIVLNTMMANVEERRGEVGMLGAIGLSPAQISFLLLSESSVFSVLGIVIGTFLGLLCANTLTGVLQDLSFNFTSLAATGLAMGTGAVVLLATLIPARRAAAMAAPSGMGHWELPEPDESGRIDFHLPFTLTRGNAVGMMAFFRRFLYNHSDAASSDFNCRNVGIDIVHGNGQPEALKTSATMWLAPYDLDVAQELDVRVEPTENEGVFGVRIQLHRTSGTEEAWLRTNYGFMDLVRRQFLLWRNLDNDARKDYIVEGAQLYQEVAG